MPTYDDYKNPKTALLNMPIDKQLEKFPEGHRLIIPYIRFSKSDVSFHS